MSLWSARMLWIPHMKNWIMYLFIRVEWATNEQFIPIIAHQDKPPYNVGYYYFLERILHKWSFSIWGSTQKTTAHDVVFYGFTWPTKYWNCEHATIWTFRKRRERRHIFKNNTYVYLVIICGMYRFCHSSK